MHFTGTLAQQFSVCQVVRPRGLISCIQLVDLLQRPRPAVAFVGDKPLQQSDRGRLASGWGIHKLAGKRCNVLKVRHIRQKAANLGVRILAGLQRRNSFRIKRSP